MNQTWQYEIVLDAAILEELGNQGWELVSVVPGPAGQMLHYLKRCGLNLRERITNQQRTAVYRKRGLRPPEEDEA